MQLNTIILPPGLLTEGQESYWAEHFDIRDSAFNIRYSFIQRNKQAAASR